MKAILINRKNKANTETVKPHNKKKRNNHRIKSTVAYSLI